MRWVAIAGGTLLVALIVAFFAVGLPFRTYYIPAESMMPTLHVYDVVMVDQWAYRFGEPARDQIAVFPPPIESDNTIFIKRIIGIPGDTLRIQGGTLFINGKPQTEPYVAEKPRYELVIKNYEIYTDENNPGVLTALDPAQANIPPKSEWTAPDRIPPHCYIMLGDNRNNSDDSHIWGFAQNAGHFATGPKAGTAAWLTGRAISILAPSKRAHNL